jgi:hypothetical protein
MQNGECRTQPPPECEWVFVQEADNGCHGRACVAVPAIRAGTGVRDGLFAPADE